MTVNLHTHTFRCHHACGTDEEYVKYAIERGVRTLGFSDHTPYFYDKDYVSPAKMGIDEMAEYFESVMRLREKYKGEIDIKLGFETEYFPKFFDRLLEEYRKYPLDYIILGQHFVGNESTPDAESSFGKKNDRSIVTRFVDQCSMALATGRFTYFAHPDVIDLEVKGRGDEEFLESEYERLIRVAIDTDTPLEINLCGVRTKRNYPNPCFWQMVGKLGADVVVGCDAHAPKQMADPCELLVADRLIRENNLKFTEKVTLKNPLF